jgi:hypothetical protein
MNGKINLFQCSDTSDKKPHYKGFISIDGVDHEFAVWPASTGNGWSGTYKPKQEYKKPEEPPQEF